MRLRKLHAWRETMHETRHMQDCMELKFRVQCWSTVVPLSWLHARRTHCELHATSNATSLFVHRECYWSSHTHAHPTHIWVTEMIIWFSVSQGFTSFRAPPLVPPIMIVCFLTMHAWSQDVYACDGMAMASRWDMQPSLQIDYIFSSSLCTFSVISGIQAQVSLHICMWL